MIAQRWFAVFGTTKSSAKNEAFVHFSLYSATVNPFSSRYASRPRRTRHAFGSGRNIRNAAAGSRSPIRLPLNKRQRRCERDLRSFARGDKSVAFASPL